MLKTSSEIIALFAILLVSLLIFLFLSFLVYRKIKMRLQAPWVFSLFIFVIFFLMYCYFSAIGQFGFASSGRPAEILKSVYYIAIPFTSIPMLVTGLLTLILATVHFMKRKPKASGHQHR